MRLKDAEKIHNGDEVMIKKTKTVKTVVDKVSLKRNETINNVACVSVKLDDGNWYGYKEII